MGSLDEDDTTHSIPTPTVQHHSPLYSDEEGKYPITWDKNTEHHRHPRGRRARHSHAEAEARHDRHGRGARHHIYRAKIDFLEDASLEKLDESEGYSFEKPCPLSTYKIQDVNDALALAGKGEFTFTTASSMTGARSSSATRCRLARSTSGRRWCCASSARSSPPPFRPSASRNSYKDSEGRSGNT